jgi:hypothetical protein
MPDSKNRLCISNFTLNWGENAMDKSIKGNLFCRPENYVLTLVRMGEPVTFIKCSYIWLLLQCETPKFTFLNLLIHFSDIWNYNEAVVLFYCQEDTCRRFSSICYFNPIKNWSFHWHHLFTIPSAAQSNSKLWYITLYISWHWTILECKYNLHR